MSEPEYSDLWQHPGYKTVTVRATIEYETRVPAEWDAAMVEFHRNESSWCADNIVQDLEQAIEHSDDCLCCRAKFEYVGEPAPST